MTHWHRPLMDAVRKLLSVRTVSASMAFAIAVVVLAATPGRAAVPAAVIASSTDEYSASASTGYVVWTQNSSKRPGHYNSFAKPAGEPRIRVNEPRTRSFAATVYDTTVVYEQVELRPAYTHNTDLKLYDLDTGKRSNPGSGVNTRHYEYEAAITPQFLYFVRSNFEAPRSERWSKLILYDRMTGDARVVARAANANHHYLISDQVNGDWTVWEDCRITSAGEFINCNVFRYRISTKQTIRIPNPGRQQFASAVTSDGTVYFARVGTSEAWRCGRDAKLLRFPVGGPATVIASLPQGKDAFSMFALDEAGGSVTLWFDREDCSTFDRDVYKLAHADTA